MEVLEELAQTSGASRDPAGDGGFGMETIIKSEFSSY